MRTSILQCEQFGLLFLEQYVERDATREVSSEIRGPRFHDCTLLPVLGSTLVDFLRLEPSLPAEYEWLGNCDSQ